MTNCLYVGIDPGASGGIAVIKPKWESPIVHNIPDTEVGIWTVVNLIVNDCFKIGSGANERPAIKVVIEQVRGFVGGEGQPGSSMFNFGWGYGGLRMALIAAGLAEGKEWRAVPPEVWQKSFLPPRDKKSGETKADHKRRLKEVAQSLFPEVSVTLKTCDALLIAEFARREGRGVFR